MGIVMGRVRGSGLYPFSDGQSLIGLGRNLTKSQSKFSHTQSAASNSLTLNIHHLDSIFFKFSVIQEGPI
ncbi:hypothetical protein AHMF7616_03553 [Adhaeribacter pallidiroseus]|uniref:Uncharacterized protein n=1 Tax=Adhaeribacter pallidiroseus TaxID=2072847 RepID=A0A369QJ49_9BACT|nr:hypothetical protein AHMF7616_03553 [Adhaeribacter pallidiroseus]